jgi:signal transduction histidine kinase/ActR/RegA family two-component response regulator
VANTLLILAVVLQGCAVAYGVFLLSRRQGAVGAWLFLLGAMLSMFVWRIVVVIPVVPPSYFNPLIAIWGSTCMVAAMFLFGREVARRSRAEAERDALLTSERAARSDAERAIRLKDDFLATLSHELRTPLAAVLGWCAVLRNMFDLRDERERALDTIERNARAQARLIDDLLDVTRLQGGALHLDFDDVPLDAPVRAALQSVQPAADAKSIKVEVHCEPQSTVRGDAGRIQQIASNLLVNAVKFTPAGGSITVTIRSAGKFAELAVADTGEGIDPAFLPHLFARFRQADSTTTRVHGGLGLGLSIVASLARLHGGDVKADSKGSGHGSTFTVRLPRAADANRLLAPPSARAIPSGSETLLAGVRVLVVDDEQDVRSALSRLLEQKGASVVALESGTGIEGILATHRPAVLVLDIGMPREDGYTLLRRIRRLPADAGGDVPAISLTAHARDEDRARAFAAGFQRHLPKPIDVTLLVSAIQDICAAPVEVRRAVEG